MKLNDNISGVRELSKRELVEIQAGETAWYWIAYGVGLIGSGISAYLAGVRYSSQTMPGLK